MAILEKEVLVTCGTRSDRYYESKGYLIPKYTDESKRQSVKKGTKILVKVEDLSEGSNVKLTKICDVEDCKKLVHNQTYSTIVILRKEGDGKDRCNDCGRKKRAITQKNNVKYERSLEYWAIKNNKKYLLDQFCIENIKTPIQISYGSADEYLWKCPKCDSKYKMSAHRKTRDVSGCPFCNGKRTNHTNSLWAIRPDIAMLLLDSQKGHELTAGSKKSEHFKCDQCGHVDKKTIVNVTRQGYTCSRCSDGASYPEKFIMSLLEQLNVSYEKEKVFEWSNNVVCNNPELNGRKQYDFYLPDLNLIIETHGEQHFGKSFNTIKDARSLIEEQENDSLKEWLAKENGFEYLVINTRISTMEWIKNNTIESDLNVIFDLKNIDWLKCHEFACSSLVKLACEYWNNGIKSTLEISKLIKCWRTTATIYLKQGAKMGWCDYDPKEEMRRSGKNNSKRNQREIVQLSLEGNFIKYHSSLTEASKEININRNSIWLCCNGKSKTGKGFRWMYKKDYENLISI